MHISFAFGYVMAKLFYDYIFFLRQMSHIAKTVTLLKAFTEKSYAFDAVLENISNSWVIVLPWDFEDCFLSQWKTIVLSILLRLSVVNFGLFARGLHALLFRRFLFFPRQSSLQFFTL